MVRPFLVVAEKTDYGKDGESVFMSRNDFIQKYKEKHADKAGEVYDSFVFTASMYFHYQTLKYVHCFDPLHIGNISIFIINSCFVLLLTQHSRRMVRRKSRWRNVVSHFWYVAYPIIAQTMSSSHRLFTI